MVLSDGSICYSVLPEQIHNTACCTERSITPNPFGLSNIYIVSMVLICLPFASQFSKILLSYCCSLASLQYNQTFFDVILQREMKLQRCVLIAHLFQHPETETKWYR